MKPSKLSRPRYNNKRKRKSKFKQGFYTPVNPEKFKETNNIMNQGPKPFYRSSWELKVYHWADMNEDVELWGTEAVAIPYLSPKDQKMHRYFPDVFLRFKDGRKVVIEIKPAAQNKNPINQAKWAAADLYCKQIGAEFMVMNEKHLGV